MKAILYTSNTGYTAEYARMLGEKTGLPVYSLEQAASNVTKGTEVFYLGWLMAGTVKGYKKAAKRYAISAVCGVGMGVNGSQLDEIREKNDVPAQTPVFMLQGGFDMNRLHGVYKMMMKTMAKTVGQRLATEPNRTADDDMMLQMLTTGGSFVSKANLEPVLSWYEARCVGKQNPNREVCK